MKELGKSIWSTLKGSKNFDKNSRSEPALEKMKVFFDVSLFIRIAAYSSI